jgi:hypothetical protein
MARKLRVEYPDAVYHFMNRGDRREAIFMDDADRQRFVETLGEGRLRQKPTSTSSLLLSLAKYVALAMLLFGIMCSSAGCQTKPEPVRTMKAEKRSAWGQQTNSIVLHYTDGSVEKVIPKGALFDIVRPSPAVPLPHLVIAFIEPRNKNIWLGGVMDVFIVTDSEILGCLLGPVVQWFDSFKTDRKMPLDAGIARFEKEVDATKLDRLWDEIGGTEIRVLGSDFWGARPGTSDFGRIRVEKVDLKGEELRLDLTNPTGVFSGSVWIHLTTKRLLRAERDGKQVFP